MNIKNKKNLFFLLFLYSLKVVAAPSNASFYDENKTNILLSGKEKTFTLRLKSNPTTGYQWYLRDYNSKMVLPIAHRYLPSESNRIGAGGVEEWVFEASARAMSYPHQQILKMIYARPFQGAEGSTSIVFRISTHP